MSETKVHSSRSFSRAALLVWLLFAAARLCWGYSLLTHEEIVDILWKDQIKPLLLERYPAATQEELRKAHAYAYGGSLIHDIGYYPFGNEFFSDLTHYVRTGDFVANLIGESADLNEYAFALGALAHYASDNSGHPLINHAVALTFPKLRAKYGEKVTYADSPKAHIRTEFGFDITQVAKNRYTSDQYHDFIGFQVSKPLLERAFLRTYGLPLGKVLGYEDLRHWHIPSRGQPGDSRNDPSCPGRVSPADSEGDAEFQQRAIPIQSVARSIRGRMGKGLSQAGILRARHGVVRALCVEAGD